MAGQVRLPGIRPLLLPPLGRIYTEGHYEFQGTQLYVNRGIGTVGGAVSAELRAGDYRADAAVC